MKSAMNYRGEIPSDLYMALLGLKTKPQVNYSSKSNKFQSYFVQTEGKTMQKTKWSN